MTRAASNDLLLKQPVDFAAQALIATTEAEIESIILKAGQKLLSSKHWLDDMKFTLNWIRAKRVEYLQDEKRKAIIKERGSDTDDEEHHSEDEKYSKRSNKKGKKRKVIPIDAKTRMSYSYRLSHIKTAEPPSTPDWRAICHNRVMDMEGTIGLSHESDQKRVGPMSLRYYAAEAISPYPETMKPSMMKTFAWKDGWIHVWNACKMRGEDSYNTFKMFANSFAHEPDFTCHDELTYSGEFLKNFGRSWKTPGELSSYASKAGLEMYGGIRRYYLKERLMEGCDTHRFEYLPYDTDILSLSKSLISQKFNFVTLVDLSYKRGLDRKVYLHLMTIPHLIGLDVTGCRIDANILFCWMMAMRNGLWNDLRMLCLGLNEIPGGAHILLSCPTLTYIEFDQNIDQINTGGPAQWERRHRLYDRIVRSFGRGHINRHGTPRFTRNHFPRQYGIGQKYRELKTLYDDLKNYQNDRRNRNQSQPPPQPQPQPQTQTQPQSSPAPPSAGDVIVKPDFGVEPLIGKRCIIQEFEIGQKPKEDSVSNDPIVDLWVNCKTDSMFIQEFFRVQHAPVTLNQLMIE